MAGETRTDLLIQARTKGFNEAQARTARLGRQGKVAQKEAREEVARLEGQLRRLVSQQTTLNRAIERTAKGSEAYKKLGQELKGIETNASRVERNIRNLERAFRDTGREMRKGAFSQGLLQGAMGPGATFLQRGPGMRRQALGMAAGRAARGVAGGLASAPFSGASGIAQALQSIPGGGVLAAPLMLSMQRAQQALQFKQVQQQSAPFLGGIAMQSAMRGVGGQAGRQAAAKARAARMAYIGSPEMEKQVRIRGDEMLAGIADAETYGEGPTIQTSPFGMNPAMRRAMDKARALGERRQDRERVGETRHVARGRIENETRQQADADAKQASRRAAAEARADVKRKFLGNIQSTGVRFGYAAPEATQMASAISQAGGGGGRGLRDMLPMAFAAQRQLGIGANVSGAFLQGGQTGGVVGARGRGGDALQEAIRGGLRMGLEGSDLTDFMSQMAGDIRAWRSTGIPLNPGSVTALGKTMGSAGLGNVRGSVAAQQFTSKSRELSTRGPQSAVELMMLQEIGGYSGGGLRDFEDAQLRLESGKGLEDPENVKRFMRRMMKSGGGGDEGRTVFRRGMRQLGVNLGVRETRLMQKQLMGGGLSGDEQEELKRIREQQGRGSENAFSFSKAGAAAGVDPALKQQAATQNNQIASGQKMIATMQNFERSTENMVKAFTTLAGGPLAGVTEGMAKLSKLLPDLVNRLSAMEQGDYVKMFFGE